MLKRFKNRLKNFDTVIARIQENKVSKDEFVVFKRSVEKQTAYTIFDDMKRLFDATVT